MIGLYIFNLTLISLLFLYHVILVCILLKWKVESELEKNGILVRPLGRWGTTLTQVPPPCRPLGKKLLHFAYRRPLLGRLKVRHDPQRRFLAQHSTSTLLRHCPNIATLCYAQNRGSESSRVTSPLVKDDLPKPFPIFGNWSKLY